MPHIRHRLTTDDLIVLRAAIDADAATEPDIAEWISVGNFNSIFEWYNEDHATFIVWRTELEEQEITGEDSPTGTVWDWTLYIGISAAEKSAWERMFSAGAIDPSRLNVRVGIGEIFSGPQNSAQRAHLLAMATRPATRAEVLYATGTGTQANPGDLSFEGNLGWQDIRRALELP